MNEIPMLFPITPSEFWKQIKMIIEEVITEKLSQQKISPPPVTHQPGMELLKVADVCEIFQITKPTLYEWLRQKKLKSFKIHSRRYFTREEIDDLIAGSS